MCGGGYNCMSVLVMDHDHERLKVALDIKKAELQTLSEKLAKAEAVKSRSPLVTAGSLVRSSLSSEEPIWVKGLHYPAQYVVRHTRSMSQHTTHKEIVEFDLPEPLTRNVETLKATKTCEGKTTTLKLASAVKMIGGGEFVALLHCGDMLAVVLRSSFILCSQADRLQIEWQQQCHQDGVLCGALSVGGGWTLLTLAAESVRAYLYSDSVTHTLDHNLISGYSLSAHSFSCVCCWYVSTTFRVAALTQSSNLLTWTLQLSDKQWTMELLSQTELSGGTTHSLVHVQGSQLLALLTDTTLYLMQGEHIKEKHSLTCSAVGSPSDVRIVWACMEEGQVLCVLCGEGLWSVVLLGQALRELFTQHMDGVRSIHVRGHQLMIAQTDCGVSVFRLDRELFRATVPDIGRCVCEWTDNGHLLALTTSRLLCDFIEP